MARYVWSQALPARLDNGEIMEPNLDYIKIVLDRSDGKPGSGDKSDGVEKESVPDKISRTNKERLNTMANSIIGENEDGVD